jgi:hypothetical protein
MTQSTENMKSILSGINTRGLEVTVTGGKLYLNKKYIIRIEPYVGNMSVCQIVYQVGGHTSHVITNDSYEEVVKRFEQ